MPVITQLKQQKKQDRVNVYLDGEFAFGIDLENLVKFNLKVEQELTEKEVEEIVNKAESQKTFDKLLRFAMTRPRSEKEVYDWFYRKKVHESLQNKLIKKLKKLDLLDDEKFAQWWVRQRTEFRPRGERVLEMELRQKGIDQQIIKNALADAEIDEVSIARKLYQKNLYKWKRYDDQEAKQKAAQFLARKGFNWDVIKKVLV